jgi:hypothetical protein
MELSKKKADIDIDLIIVDSIDTACYSSAGRMGKEGQWPMRKGPGCLLDSTDDLI